MIDRRDVHPGTNGHFKTYYTHMKKRSLSWLLVALALVPIAVQASTLSQRLKGYVLLQVEAHGEAWYVLPSSGLRTYLQDGAAAFAIMRSAGLGITDANLAKVRAGDPTLIARLRGYILLQVQAHGEAYYVCPRDSSVIYMKDGAAAYQLLRSCGLGISTSNLMTIPVAPTSATPPGPMSSVPVTPPAPSVPVPTGSSGAPVIAGCQIFPSNNPWNEDISKLPLNPNSDAYIASIGLTGHLHPDLGQDPTYGIPMTIVGSAQAMVPITFDAYGDESDPGPYPIPADARVESGGDAHVLVLQSGTCKLYELYAAQKDANGPGWTAGSGAMWDLSSNALRPDGWTSADAAGLPILPGLVKVDEVVAGHIDHAIRFSAQHSPDGYIHPATHQAGSSNTNYPPMGLRVRLKADYDISNLTGQAKVIATAMKTYGMILADNGSNWFFQGDTDPRWNDDELNELKTIPGSAFEAVDTGPILK